MAQRKQSFRFRIPWLSVPSESFARRTRDRPKSPPHADTSVPIQRPSKHSVITPLAPPSPTKTEESPRDKPQNQSPPHPTHPPPSSVAIESPLITQPKPPSPLPPPQPSSHAGSPSHVNIASSSPKTEPHSPSHLASDSPIKVPKSAAEETTHPISSSASEQEKEKMVMSEPKHEELKSPERMSTHEQQVSSVASSSPVSKIEPATHPHPSSPLASERTGEEFKSKTEESIPQEEKEKMAQVVSHEAEPKVKSPLKTMPKSPETFSQSENHFTRPTAILGDEQRSTIPKSPLETQIKSLKPEEEKDKVVHETNKARKGKDTTTGQPSRHTIASSASGTATKAKDSYAKALHTDKKPSQETVERRIMFATSNPIGKDTRVLSSTDQGTRNVSSISHETTGSSSEEKAPLQKGIKDDITKFVHKLAASVHSTQPMDEKQFSIITLAGDNRGATMHVGSETAKKEDSIHIHRAYKSDPEESIEVTTDGEEENTKEDTEEGDDDMGMAYVNSNIQSINNSLMFHGSITERDPGVQVTLPPQKPIEPIKPSDKPGLETQRTQFNISRAEKSTYQPTVPRRCLRSPFLEPSNSDQDNPDKPRRHGCKFSCDKNIEDIEIL